MTYLALNTFGTTYLNLQCSLHENLCAFKVIQKSEPSVIISFHKFLLHKCITMTRDMVQ